jgi:FMN phosphatase YigB (HAD superfamily)
MATSFLYFDLGNVLLSFSHETMCRQMAAAAGVETEAVRRALFDGPPGESLQWRFERGDFDTAGAYELFCGGVGCRPEQAALYAAASDIFVEIPESVALVRRLAAAGNRLGVLSNTNPVDWNFVSGKFAFLRECFEIPLLSFEARSMKPSAAIYEHAVRRAGVPTRDVFFTDDKAENVAGALAAGLDAVLFTTTSELEEVLRRRGVPGA